MKKIFIIPIFILILSLCTGCNNSRNSMQTKQNQANFQENSANNNENQGNTNQNDISNQNNANISNQNTSNNFPENTSNNSQENQIHSNKIENETNTPLTKQTKEKNSNNSNENIIAEFSTKIKDKEANRLNNIQITCKKLNETIIEPKKEFSFCNTIGKATEEKGYKKADVIIDKKIEKALGGGNCQVSSTLYNAILKISDIKVTERHPHGKRVTYVPEGKDAAVSYGSKDLKFINNSQNKLKILANTDNKKITIKIISLK